MHVRRQSLSEYAFINLNCFLGGVQNDKTIRALRDVRLNSAAKLEIPGLVEIIVEFLKELLTCKQKRRPLSA